MSEQSRQCPGLGSVPVTGRRSQAATWELSLSPVHLSLSISFLSLSHPLSLFLSPLITFPHLSLFLSSFTSSFSSLLSSSIPSLFLFPPVSPPFLLSPSSLSSSSPPPVPALHPCPRSWLFLSYNTCIMPPHPGSIFSEALGSWELPSTPCLIAFCSL